MTLARVTTWADGQTLTAAALNGEFDNIINNPNSLVTLNRGVSRVVGLTGSLSGNTGSFAALGYQMRSTLQEYSVVASSSFSINTRTAGPIANGRDQAGAFASTSIHFYAISTGPNSTAPAGVCSSVPPTTGPTLPTGYSGWTYLCSGAYTVGTSAFTQSSLSMPVMGPWVHLPGGIGVLTGGTATIYTIVDLSTAVPTMATRAKLLMTGAITSTGSDVSSVQSISALGALEDLTVRPTFTTTSTGAVTTLIDTVMGDVPLITPQTIYYKNAVVAGTSPATSIRIFAYSVPNGDAY